MSRALFYIMELVYPIYIDTPMMTSFLASLEGGLIEEATLEEKTSSSKERGKAGEGGAKIGGLFSGLASLEAKVEASQKSSEGLESSYQSTIRYPEAALFIRLRELLKKEGLVRDLHGKSFDELKMGELVEFSGIVSPNPSYQIRSFSQSLMPVLEAMSTAETAQFQGQVDLIENLKFNEIINIETGNQMFSNEGEAKKQKNLLKAQIRMKVAELENMQGVMNGIEKFMPTEQIDKLIFDFEDSKAVCVVYPDFARNKRVQDIHYAHWSCVGKVIGKIEDGKYDLLKGLPVGYFASNFMEGLASTVNSGGVQLDLTPASIEGRIFVIATLAIFA